MPLNPQAPVATPSTPLRSPRPWFGAALIIGAILLAWSNSLTAPFQLDDHSSILGNASIRRLWPPGWLNPPATAGETVSGRPVLNFTFAVNHALGGLEVRGYHAVNLLIHAAAALALWGILRRTPAAGGAGAALAATLLWAVHPLQTAAVTYVVQRAESLAGLCGLLTLYAFVRGAEGLPCSGPLRAPKGSKPAVIDRRYRISPRAWFVLSVACCLLGVGAKETVAVVPLLVLLYDRAFLAGGFRAAWRARGRVHAALFATWLPLAALVLANDGRGGSAGAGLIGAGTYFLTQCGAIIRYLGLVFWPAGQVFDYGTPVAAGFGTVAPQCLLLAALAAGTLWLLRRNHRAGFAGAAFFLLLAPSSSFMPVATQTMAEHRMYLPLAVVVALVCAAVASRGIPYRRSGSVLAAVGVLVFGAVTFARNRTYGSELALWGDTVAKRPDNPRARYNLGLALAGAGRAEEAVAEFRHALALRPEHAFAHFELAKVALLAGRWEEAAGGFARALAADPHFVNARVNLARALARLGRADEAVAHYRQALADQPGATDIRSDLAGLLIQRGRADEARELLLGASRPDDTSAATWFALGNLLARQERFVEAIAAYRAAVARDPAHVEARGNLANSLLFTGRIAEAIAEYEAILRVRPADARVQENLRLAREALQGR